MKARNLLIGCFALVFLILAGGIAFALVGVPSVSDQLPPYATSLIVILTAPAHTSDVPLNASTQVTAEAVGDQPIVRLDLWVDGALVESRPAPSGAVSFATFWSWMPAVEGRHSLFVEGADAAGRVVRSNVIWVNATHRADLVVTLPSAEGETLESLSEKFGVPLDQVKDQNPNLGENTPLPPGQPVNVPLPPPGPPGPSAPPAPQPSPPPGPTQPAPSGPPNKFNFWLTGILAVTSPPAAPELAAAWEGCSIRLFVTDKAATEDGFFIYRSDFSAPGWARIATLDAYKGAQPFVYVDPDLYGEYYYYIAAFNKAGESPSAVVSLSNYSPQCLTSQWQGLSLKNGKITTSQAMDKIYCYLSVDYGPWSRVPAAPDTFIEPTNGAFDMSQYLNNLASPPPPGGVTLILECWGWQGGTLYYLGKVEQKIAPGPVNLPADLFGLQGEIEAAPVENMSQSKYLAAPTGFTRTGDKQVCAGHAPPGSGGFASYLCEESFKYHLNALIWNWSPGVTCWSNKPCDLSNVVQQPDGYRIYDILGQFVTEVNDGKTTFKAMILTPSPIWKDWLPVPLPPCYTVRAFKGPQESANSNPYCWDTVPEGIKTVTIKASSLLTGAVWGENSAGILETCGTGPILPYPPPNRIRVGYWHSGENNCFNWQNSVYRGAVWFDLSQVKGKVYAATLEYYAFLGSFQPGDEEAPYFAYSCASQLLLGTEAWMGKVGLEYWIPGVPYLSFNWSSKVPGPLSLNVTSAVESWRINPASNFGFVFRHTEEDIEDDTEDNTYGCWTEYGDFVLTVMYYP